MGLFDALRSIATGKPVFTPSEPGAQPGQPAPAGSQPTTPVAPTQKVIPQVMVEQLECHNHGTAMQVEAHIINHSSISADIDQIQLLGSSYDAGTILRPGEKRTFMIYNGPRPQSTTNTELRIYVKDPTTSDVFYARHSLELRKLPDNSYDINRARFEYMQDV